MLLKGNVNYRIDIFCHVCSVFREDVLFHIYSELTKRLIKKTHQNMQ